MFIIQFDFFFENKYFQIHESQQLQNEKKKSSSICPKRSTCDQSFRIGLTSTKRTSNKDKNKKLAYFSSEKPVSKPVNS